MASVPRCESLCCPRQVSSGRSPPPSTSWPIAQCYYWISESREEAYITSPFVTPHPPWFTLILSFIFFLFNNSLSALWPLIKMNSLCCRLLPSSLSLSFLKSLLPPRPPLTYLPPYIFLDVPYLPPPSPSSPSCPPSTPLTSLFSFNFSPSDTAVHHEPGSGRQPPP